ncbi:hypothetical protein ACFVT5_09420 [Streptomyces sp. NPDC058001]|uniref:hypothetical protein n=1 Tax=Streptomyces sp. NPDC058001 TaxID=3346300 RepID=UPI0036E58460
MFVTAGGLTGAGPLIGLSADDIRTTVDSRLWPAFAADRLCVNAIRFGRIDTSLLRSRPGLDSDDAGNLSAERRCRTPLP